MPHAGLRCGGAPAPGRTQSSCGCLEARSARDCAAPPTGGCGWPGRGAEMCCRMWQRFGLLRVPRDYINNEPATETPQVLVRASRLVCPSVGGPPLQPHRHRLHQHRDLLTGTRLISCNLQQKRDDVRRSHLGQAVKHRLVVLYEDAGSLLKRCIMHSPTLSSALVCTLWHTSYAPNGYMKT